MTDFNVADGFLTALQGEKPVYACSWITFNIDTHTQLSQGWISDKYLVKVAGGAVVELYKPMPNSWESLTLNGESTIEKYELGDGVLTKYDLNNNVLQENFVGTLNELPAEWRVAIQDQPWASQVFLWAVKPYGRIVEYSLEVTE